MMVSCPLWALAIDIFVGQPIFTGDNGVGVKKEHKDNQMVITDNLTPGPLSCMRPRVDQSRKEDHPPCPHQPWAPESERICAVVESR